MSKTKIVAKPGERGNYMIEFGLSIVLFFGIVLGILDVSRGIYAYNFLAGAAKEGARYAMIHGSSSGAKASATDIQNVVQNWLIGMADSSATVTTTWSPATENPGSQVTVKVQYTFTPMSNFLVGSWNLQSTSQTTVIQ